jgi:hypothetical protein
MSARRGVLDAVVSRGSDRRGADRCTRGARVLQSKESVASFSEKLAPSFEPVGVGVTWKIEPAPAFGNEVGTGADLLVSWIKLN